MGIDVTSPLKVAVVGLGQRGLQHLRSLWSLQDEGEVEIVALVDAFEGNLAEAKIAQFVSGFRLQGISTFSKFDDLWAQAKPEALYMVIPPGFHSGIPTTVRAVQRGCARIHEG